MARTAAGMEPNRVGAYRLVERLGVGGMACVYRARRDDAPDAGDVALKRLHPHLANNPTAIASLVREVRIGCLLDHPVIRRAFALCREQDELFLLMEYVNGWSLREVIKQASAAGQWLTTRSVLAVLARLCRALHYAHEVVDETGAPARFVHRDVSPANVIVSTEGQLKLIDMGVARARPTSPGTGAGRVKGKYGYMAPEVLNSAAFDRRADVFSVGVVAWELLSLCKLFPVSNPPVDVGRVRARSIPPPSARNPSCPVALDAIVLRALAAEPSRRWATCAALADALEEVSAQVNEPLVDTTLFELTEIFADTTVASPPPLPYLRPRLARGTAESPVMTSMPTSISVAPRPRGLRWGTAVVGAVVGAALTLVGVARLDGAPPAASRATEAFADRVLLEVGPDAGAVSATRDAPMNRADRDAGAPALMNASELTRLSGPWPRSRSARYPYRALLCIDASGAVTSATLLEGPERLERRITRALLRWRYRPVGSGAAARPACFVLASEVRKLRRRG